MKDKRKNIMTEEQINLADQIRAWYKDSRVRRSASGLDDLWEKVDEYYEGKRNTRQNMIHSHVEKHVREISTKAIKALVKVNELSSDEACKCVSIVLDWIIKQNKLIRQISRHERMRAMYGTGIFRTIHDPARANGYGLPVIESVNPKNIFVDPKISDPYEIQDSDFIIEALEKPISWAKETYGDEIAEAIQISDDTIEFRNYIHILCWFRTDGKLRLVEISECGVLLYDSFDKLKDESFYPTNEYPYFFTPMYQREESVWGKGDAELLLNLQDLSDELDKQILNNARLAANPQRLVDVSCNIDLEKWTNESGLIIPTMDINGARTMKVPEMSNAAISRLFDISSLLDTKSTAGSKYMIKTLERTLEDVLKYCCMLAIEYCTEVRVFKHDGLFFPIKLNDYKQFAKFVDIEVELK